MAEKVCGKCHRVFDIALFGSQRYCKRCWQAYKKERAKAHYLDALYELYPHLRKPPADADPQTPANPPPDLPEAPTLTKEKQ